jgi:hypothetical protein
MTPSTNRLSREEICEALGLPDEAFARIAQSEGLGPDPDGRYDPLHIAPAAVRFGLGRADIADGKIAAVAAALSAVRPALERLAGLADRAGLEGEAHHRAMVEVAAFFTAFAEAMNRASAILAEDESSEQPREP